VLSQRLGKFNLRLAVEKTQVIRFSRFQDSEGSSFDFLGFEYRWGTSRKGKRIVKLRTSRKKYRQALGNFTAWIKSQRHIPLRRLICTLNQKLRGYYNYYGVIGNYRSVEQFFDQAMKILKKWLNRRSQHKSYTCRGFDAMLNHHRIERPRITEIDTTQQLVTALS
jgi:hypothetical protein